MPNSDIKLGEDEFKSRYPEFVDAINRVKARIRNKLKKATTGKLDT